MMSILIKGMEMPFCCLVCPCSGTDDKEVWVCEASELRRLTTEDKIECRPEWCPLVSVPPHGRLIDADTQDIYRREEQAWHDYEQNSDNEYLGGVKDGLHEAAKQLSTAPTIIPAEEGEP